MTFALTARHSPEVHVAVIVWKQKEVSAIEQAIEEYAQNDAQHHKGQAGFPTVMQPVEIHTQQDFNKGLQNHHPGFHV
jgi:hypothetical protein